MQEYDLKEIEKAFIKQILLTNQFVNGFAEKHLKGKIKKDLLCEWEKFMIEQKWIQK